MRPFFFLLIVLGFQCSQPVQPKNEALNEIPDEKVRDLLENAFQKAGGLGKWKSIDTLSFLKKSVLYLKDGSIEWEAFQQQQFIFKPYFQIRLAWQKDSTSHEHIYDGEKSIQYEDENSVSEVDGPHPSLLSASYVIGMPYELPNDAKLLSYEGTITLDSVLLSVIKVDYEKTDDASDTWWYFFDQNDNYWGSKVYHSPTYALIENTSMDTTTGLAFPSYRRSYRIDSLNNKQFLRAEFWYSEYRISGGL